MDMDHDRFVTVWTQAPSLEVASAVLGMSPKCVIRQAMMMRAAGVLLKDLGDIQKGRGETARDQTTDSPVLPLAEATSNETTTSYISLLKTDAQLRFYAKYAVGRNGGPSLAESVANAQALRSGASGSAGIASGVVEDVAFEAVAQLAVAPPNGFNPEHRRVAGYVAQHVRLAVTHRLNREYGSNANRFGGHVPTDAVEFVGREPDPSAPVDYIAALASTQARETERARQLEQARTVLPGGVIPTDRAGRIAILRAFGEGKTQAVTNAAEHRFYGALAKHVRAALKLDAVHNLEQKSQLLPPYEHLAKPQSDNVPSRIRQHLTSSCQPKSRAQLDAEQFVRTWCGSRTAAEVAQTLGRKVRSVTSFAARLRRLGVPLKLMPNNCGPLVRSVLGIIPSRN